MATAEVRFPVQAPAFIRLLARLAETGVPSSGPALAERLGQWLDWNRAVVLSRALDGRLPNAGETGNAPDLADAEECARVRAGLVEAITSERGLLLPAADLPVGFAPLRSHALAMQRAMQAATGRLRGQLRDRLAARSPVQARLAEVDGVMEQTLSPREHALLALVPVALAAHFERLRAAAAPAAATATDLPAGPWLALFRRDLQDVLLAELDVRFQPVEGLLAALRTD